MTKNHYTIQVLNIFFLALLFSSLCLLVNDQLKAANQTCNDYEDNKHWDEIFGPQGSGRVSAIAVAENGNVYVGTSVSPTGERGIQGIAKWNGKRWMPLGKGIEHDHSPALWITSISTQGNDVYVGGRFTKAGDKDVLNLAKWDGNEWTGVGGIVIGLVRTVFVAGDHVYVGGDIEQAGTTAVNNIAKWDGSSWSDLNGGITGDNVRVNSIVEYKGEIIVGGRFKTAGGKAVNNMARWNGTEWLPFDNYTELEGLTGSIWDMDVRGDSLAIVGTFSEQIGIEFNRIALWDGNKWNSLGKGVDEEYAEVHSVAMASNGIYIGGYFSKVDNATATNIAFWDGNQWNPLGTYGEEGTENSVTVLALRGDDLIAGGNFHNVAGNISVYNIARWDGFRWYGLEHGIRFEPRVFTLATDGKYIYAGGDFSRAGGVPTNKIAKWDNQRWNRLKDGIDGGWPIEVRDINVYSDTVYVAGSFNNAGEIESKNLAYWANNEWHGLIETIDGPINSVDVNSRYVVIGGNFSIINGKTVNHIAKYDKQILEWKAIGNGVGDNVHAVNITDNEIIIGGEFINVDDKNIRHFAIWRNGAWYALDNQLNGPVYAIENTDSGLYIGGNFTRAGAITVNRIALLLLEYLEENHYNETWEALDVGVDAPVYSIARSSNYTYVGGTFRKIGDDVVNYAARWDGKSWRGLGSGFNGHVHAITVLDDEVYFGGTFTETGGQLSYGIARWFEKLPTWVPEITSRPQNFYLRQNYPNPFNPETTISFSIPRRERVTITIYDLLGREITRILDETVDAGTHNIIFHAAKYPSGTYFYRLQTESYSEVKKMVLIR